jgi:uncharacterized GH25 family protein
MYHREDVVLTLSSVKDEPQARRHARRWAFGATAFWASLFALAGVLLLTVPAVHAHYPWIAVDASAQPHGTFRITFGHAFLEHGQLPADRLEGIRLVEPDGSVQPLSLGEGKNHPLPAAAGEGARLIVAEQQPAYWSRTHEGRRMASREEYPAAFSCTQSGHAMKAVVGDGPGSAWQHVQGHVLELVPMNDPTALRAGDPMEIQVLFHGKPWKGELKATFAGYEGASEDRYAVTVQTDTHGVARLVPAASGNWLVRVHAIEDHPEPAVCDRRSYFSTLTFTFR